MERKKYQVFISSTYTDLIQERSAVIQCLLDNDCIPVGMEQFPASNMSQMEYIKKMLEDCDYYILILAGRYGSEDDDGVGFTEKEYNYAISHGIPVMSFVVKDINALAVSQCEKKKKQQDKLLQFREKVCNGRLVKFYSDIGELKGNVTASIYKCIHDFPAKGWVRGVESNAIETSKTTTISQDVNIKKGDSILLTANSFSQFIDSVNYRIWVDAIKNADNVCDDEHFGGIFFMYSRIIENLSHDSSEYKVISDSLLINKALYNIASQARFYSLCDFLTTINKDMVVSACQDIKQYMLENIHAFGEQGLVDICFQKIMAAKEDNNFDKDFWERCLKEIFELHRMIQS